ncbi:unnamed protein product [Fusarium venenatum]|uniref:Uncharacterized protein n=1 Tax=Fusarium venenatum TaxID=56646 RepID=A0A2L2SQS9_9HYPO|nr:uncharacterized protein FVRRES_11862 [Fusarium venenatum]CEI39171.1 unnamed protein product [Fusarium venenatum]
MDVMLPTLEIRSWQLQLVVNIPEQEWVMILKRLSSWLRIYSLGSGLGFWLGLRYNPVIPRSLQAARRK